MEYGLGFILREVPPRLNPVLLGEETGTDGGGGGYRAHILLQI